MACGGFTCSKNALAALNVLYIIFTNAMNISFSIAAVKKVWDYAKKNFVVFRTFISLTSTVVVVPVYCYTIILIFPCMNMMVACILIGMAAYGKASALIATIEMMGGIIACGVFLMLIAVVGLIGAVQHHQVLLFFYMIVLFLLFLVQFAVACALLALDETQRLTIAAWGWNHSHPALLNTTQVSLGCCGFDNNMDPPLNHPACSLPLCENSNASCCHKYPTIDNASLTNGSCPYGDCWSSIGPHMNEAVKTVGGISLFFSFTEMLGVWLTVRYRNQKDPRANPSAFL